ncbi:MAG TPA: UvrD-helicase domain-containing protein [Firmicutes bacterium]|nr:UvrD-helicase domain-containing protein [Candidatus Fermentithermobacillaceae bacterium]
MKLTPSQIEAIESPARRLQVVACAGSGKTEVLARRVLKFLSDGLEPSAIVAFTFTEKAAEELKDRIDRRAGEVGFSVRGLPPSSAGLFAGTIHGYCLRLLQSSGEFELYDVLTEEREWALVYRFAKRLGLVSLFENTWPGTKVSRKVAVDVFLENLSVFYNEMIPLDCLDRYCPAFAEAVRRYEALTDAMKLISFDQIIVRAVRAIRSEGPVRRLLEGRVQEVLVDEYQDLNRAQEALLWEFASMGAGITVVGDDDQAIYQWRGGDVGLFLGFAGSFGAERKTLGVNKRSKPSIVRFSREFARTIEPRIEKDIRHEDADDEPCVELVVARNPEDEALLIVERIRKLVAEGTSPGDIAILFRSVRTSAAPVMKALSDAGVPAAIAGKVSLLDHPETRLVAHVFVWWAGGSWRPDETEERVTEELLIDEITEVTGKSREAALKTLSALREVGERVRRDGVRDLIETYMSVLKILGLPTAEERTSQQKSLGAMSSLLVSFENSVKRGMPEGILRSPSLLRIPGAEQERHEDEMISRVEGEGSQAPDISGTSPGFQRGEVYLWWLRGFLERFSSEAVEVSSEGVERLPDAVNILTIHQSKGLEFPVVFVPCLVNGRFPSSRMGQEKKWYLPESIPGSLSRTCDGVIQANPAHDASRESASQTSSASETPESGPDEGRGVRRAEEQLFDKRRYEGRMSDERRLFYVAATRARDLLILSTFRDYGGGAGTRAKPAAPSPFLEDVRTNPDLRKEVRQYGQGVVRGRRASSQSKTLMVDCGQLLVYSECPRKYYLRYECGFAPCLAPALGFGKLAHHVVTEAARRAQAGVPVTPEEVAEILHERFYLPFASSEQKDIMFQALLRTLRAYAEKHGEDLKRVTDVEFPFEVPVDGSRVRGRIDLVLSVAPGDVSRNACLLNPDRSAGLLNPDLINGGPPDGRPSPSTCGESRTTPVEVVDLKTSENRPPLPQHKNQLRLYGKALSLLGREAVRLTIHDLDSDDGQAIQVEPDDAEFGEFEAQMDRWLWGIKNSKFDPTPGPACKDCDYKSLCGVTRVQIPQLSSPVRRSEGVARPD